MVEDPFADPSAEGLLEAQRRLQGHDQSAEVQVHQVWMEMRKGAVSAVHFSFIRHDGEAMYLPQFSLWDTYKCPSQDAAGSASLLTNTYWNAQGFDIQKGEYLFWSPQRHPLPWRFGFQVMLPFSLASAFAELRLRNIKAVASDPANPRPAISMWENYLVDGQYQTRRYLWEATPAADQMEDCRFAIVSP